MENRLEEIIEEQGRQKNWLAKKADVTTATLRLYIKGKAPNLEKAYRIADALEKTVYDIWPRQK